MDRRILFTTVYRTGENTYDHFSLNTRRKLFRYSFPRINSFGLRFIRENIPGIRILEYPTWDEYAREIEDFDIIGFSFFLNETPEILRMVEYARTRGKEVWAGNYGAMTPEIRSQFDRVFVGYSEHQIASLLGKSIGDIKHPSIVMYISLPFGLRVNIVGILFTTRGCNMGCKFCQTPQFCPKVSKLSLESIESALLAYKRQGIREVIIFDENFGMFKTHTDEVTRLLRKHGFYWFCMTRADRIGPNMGTWAGRGMLGAFIGIESFSQENLDYIQKREDIATIENVLDGLKRRNMFTLGYYVVGFENETVDSIKKDIEHLAALGLDMNQICVITPLPMTPLWSEIEENFGIFEKDYHRFDTKHLVWNHPHISPEEMEELLDWSFRTVYPRRRMVYTALKYFRKYTQDMGFLAGLRYLGGKLLRANTFDYKQ